MKKINIQSEKIMKERFGKDSLWTIVNKVDRKNRKIK